MAHHFDVGVMRYGTRDHDAPGTRCEGLAHLDRLAIAGALYEIELRQQRRLRTKRQILVPIFWLLLLAFDVFWLLTVIYDMLVVP